MYSSVAQLRMNLMKVSANQLDDPMIIDRIDHADDDIQMDIGKYIDFSLLPTGGYADSNFPTFVNHLSQYKTCEHVLAKLFGAKRQADEVSDIQYWTKQYNDLLDKILMNRIPITLKDGTNLGLGQFRSKTGKQNVNPALGNGKYGRYESNERQAIDRPRDGKANGGLITTIGGSDIYE